MVGVFTIRVYNDQKLQEFIPKLTGFEICVVKRLPRSDESGNNRSLYPNHFNDDTATNTFHSIGQS